MTNAKTFLAGIVAVTAVLIGTPTPASADVFNFSLTSDFCTGTCGTAPFGNVRVADIGAGEVQVTVTLTAPEIFAKTGAGGMQTLLFDLSGTPTLTDYTDVSSNQPIVLNSTTAGSIMADGSGTWQYAVNCPSCGSGTSAPQLLSPITFDISATGLSAASFVQNGNGLYFAADIQGTNGNTGDVGAPTRMATTPEPSSVMLFGSILIGVAEVLRRRVQRKA